MNFRKILMKVIWGLAVLLVIVLIGLTVYQHQLMKRASRETSAGTEATGDTGGSVVKNDAPMDTEAETANPINQRIELQKKILADPSIQESIRSSLETQYAPLFRQLTLSPERKKKLGELLTDSAMAYLELNPEILLAVTDEEKAVLQRRYDYLRKETMLRIEAILGHDDYEIYRSYEERAFSRTVASGFAESLASGDRLTEVQQKALIDIMYREAQKVYADIGYDPTSRLEFPSDMDPDTVSKRIEVTDRILFNSAESSKGILSQSQLKAYYAYLRNYSEQVGMSQMMLRQQYAE